MPTYHLAAACRLVTKPSRRECLSSDRNQRFWKGRGGCSKSLGRRSIDTFFRRSCVSIHHNNERIDHLILRLDPRTCRDQHWHWTNCTVTRRSKAPLDRSKHIPVLRASDGLEFLFPLDLRVNHEILRSYTLHALARLGCCLYCQCFFRTNLINKFKTFYKNIYLCYDLNIYTDCFFNFIFREYKYIYLFIEEI